MGWRAGLALLVLAVAGAPSATADDPLPSVLRVGTSGDYAPFSSAVAEQPGEYQGFDIAVARAYAADRGMELRFVSFRWPELVAGLKTGRYHVAMSGVTIRPERSSIGRFSVPVAEAGAVVLARPQGRFSELGDLDRRQIRIAVNAGGHLERVAAEHFPHAIQLAIRDNQAVRRALAEGQVDAAVSDTLEAPGWMTGIDDVELLGPFTLDRKAYLVAAGHPALATDLDRWLLEREADGTLARLRLQHLGGEAGATATPLNALLAAMDERLSLMPLVAVAKRSAGLPLEVPEREAVVLDEAVASALASAKQRGVPAPAAKAVRALFRAQMEAAKQVQWDAIRDPDFARPETTPDLDTELRPAILRIGDRIAQLLTELPPNLDRGTVRAEAARALRVPRLSDASRGALADAVVALSAAERN